MKLIISDILITVNKKNIKNMHLYVKPPDGVVSVSAPLDVNDATIERFVRTRMSWIRKQIDKFEAQARQSEREHVSGETLYVWGKPYYLQVLKGSRYNISLQSDKVIFTVREGSAAEQRDKFLREWYRELLKAEISKRLPVWEKETGLQASSWQTKYMTTKWGTCNTKTGKIWLNLQLAKKTHECLDYVILHELIHLVERKHNDRFIALMDKYMPLWREVRKSLNDQTLDSL